MNRSLKSWLRTLWLPIVAVVAAISIITQTALAQSPKPSTTSAKELPHEIAVASFAL
jgi:hypothetical protein